MLVVVCLVRYITLMRALRRAHATYTAIVHRLRELRTDHPSVSSVGLPDAEAGLLGVIEGGLNHGLGVMNLMLGMLPPKVLLLRVRHELHHFSFRISLLSAPPRDFGSMSSAVLIVPRILYRWR